MTEPDPLAVAVMVAYCGWDPTILLTDAVATLDGTGASILGLPTLHLTGVSSVAVTDGWGNATTYLAADVPATVGPGSANVGWSDNGCLVWRACGVWPEGQGNIVVTYSGGYDDIPEDLTAALNSVGKRTGSALLGASSRRMGTAGVTFGTAISAGDLLMVEKMVFDRYRIPRIR